MAKFESSNYPLFDIVLETLFSVHVSTVGYFTDVKGDI